MNEKYNIEISETTYNYILKHLKSEMENAMEMSEVPGQRWAQAWRDEYWKFYDMIKEIECPF